MSDNKIKDADNSHPMDKEIYQIFDRDSTEPEGVYSGACHDEFNFDSAAQARSSNCHDTYKDMFKYKINKYKVAYTLIEEDCDRDETKYREDRIRAEADARYAKDTEGMSVWDIMEGSADSFMTGEMMVRADRITRDKDKEKKL